MTAVLDRFPKVRPPLPPAYQELYRRQYKANRDGATAAASLAQRLERWMHSRVAADVRGKGGGATLEIGAGTLNHLPFEPRSRPYDIVEPQDFLYAGSPYRGAVRDAYADVAHVPAGRRYPRIVSIAAFEHLCRLPEVVARSGLLLADGGHLRVAIPSEGTFLWTLGWRCTTGLEFRLRHGLDYGVLMRHEHVNSAREVAEVLAHFFERTPRRTLGPAAPVSLYQFFDCTRPRAGACSRYLEDAAPG